MSLCKAAASLHSKRFRGAKSEEETGLSAFCVASVSVEQRAKKKRGFRRFAKTPKAPFLLRSLLHGNACYAG